MGEEGKISHLMETSKTFFKQEICLHEIVGFNKDFVELVP